MRIFSFTKSIRARVAEKKTVTVGPPFNFCPPSDLNNRFQLLPLAQARSARQIRLRTVVDTQEMTATVGIWEDTCGQSPQAEDALVQGDATSGYASSSSSSSFEADSSLAPRVSNHYVGHKPYDVLEDSILGVDQSALFAEIEEMLANPVASIDKRAQAVEPVQIERTSRQTKRAAIMCFENTFIPLHVAMARDDIRYRREGFEMV